MEHGCPPTFRCASSPPLRHATPLSRVVPAVRSSDFGRNPGLTAVRSMPPAAQAGRKAADSPGRHRAARSKAQGKETTDQLGHLRERMAKLEGLLEGTARRDHRRAPHIAALLAGEHDRHRKPQRNPGVLPRVEGRVSHARSHAWPRLTERGRAYRCRAGALTCALWAVSSVSTLAERFPNLVGVPQTDTERPEGRGSGQQVNEDRGPAATRV